MTIDPMLLDEIIKIICDGNTNEPEVTAITVTKHIASFYEEKITSIKSLLNRVAAYNDTIDKWTLPVVAECDNLKARCVELEKDVDLIKHDWTFACERNEVLTKALEEIASNQYWVNRTQRAEMTGPEAVRIAEDALLQSVDGEGE